MIKEELIKFETAKLAKEKGFNEVTVFAYTKKEEIAASFPTESYLGTLSREDFESYGWINNNLPWEDPTIHDTTYLFSAPTQSLLQKWIREVLKYDIDIRCNCTSKGQYFVTVFGRKTKFPTLYLGNTYYKTYEEALEVGLQEALKLI